MSDDLLLAGAMLLNIAGFAWLALAMDTHWQEVSGGGKTPRRGRTPLRIAAAVAFLMSLLACKLCDHASIAALVWVMSLTAGALLVAFALTWRPGLLRPFSWLIRRASRADTEP